MLRQLLQRLEARPRWMRWLDAAPAPVQEADRAARRSMCRIQLPLMLIGAAICLAGKYAGWWFSSPLTGFTLLTASMVAILWPVHLWRLGRTAHAAMAHCCTLLSRKLRLLAGACYLLSALCAMVIVALLVLTGMILLR